MRYRKRLVLAGCLSALIEGGYPCEDVLIILICVLYAEVEAELVEDEQKKQKRTFLTVFFSPIFLKAFSINFFGEWGDKSQLATIGLAAYENPLGVVLGGIVAQTLCTAAAVRTNCGSFRWNAFHCFRHPVISFSDRFLINST